MGKFSATSEPKAVTSIKQFRQDLDRNLVKLVDVESKITHLNNKALDLPFTYKRQGIIPSL
jgi:hypothetical protein